MTAATLLESRRTTTAIAIVLVALGAVPALLGRMSPDTAWLLYGADRLLHGARLFVDVVEVNPPLIVWLDLVPVALGHLLHVPGATVFALLVIGLMLGSVAATARLLPALLPDRPAARRALVLATTFVLLPLAREDFGQREHLFLALAMPYVLLTAVRAGGGSTSRKAAAMVGLAAALGIALKPYFVLLWLGLGVGLAAARGWRMALFRVESVVVVAAGVVYLAAVLRWAPDYFRIVPLMAGPYYDFLSNTLLVTALLGDGALVAVVSLLAFLALRRAANATALWTVLAWAVAALWLVGVLQHKGWRYHFYPSFALGLWLLVVILVDVRRPLRLAGERVYSALSLAVVAALGAQTLGACLLQSIQPRHPRYDVDPDLTRLVPVVRQHAGRHGMSVLSWSIASAFPLANSAGVEVTSRFPSLWSLGALYWAEVRSDAPIGYRSESAMGPLERYVNDAVIADLRAGEPGVLLVLRPGPDRRQWGLRRLDFLGYFQRDTRFAAWFQRYRFLAQVGEYWVFVRAPDGAPPSQPWRRPGGPPPGTPDPGLAGGSAPLRGSQVLSGIAFLAILGMAFLREARLAGGSARSPALN